MSTVGGKPRKKRTTKKKTGGSAYTDFITPYLKKAWAEVKRKHPNMPPKKQMGLVHKEPVMVEAKKKWHAKKK